MNRLPKEQLKQLFENIVSKEGGKCGKANPFIFQKDTFKCHVFIKNISPAYFTKYPDNSRVQLPSSSRFKKVIESPLDFLIIGYDPANEVFVSWNPFLIKKRLNEKRNVSVYSRFTWQREVSNGKLLVRYLANNEKVVLFNKELLTKFFDCYYTLFKLEETNILFNKQNDNVVADLELEKLRSVVRPLLIEHKVLQAVSVAQDLLSKELQYRNYTFRDYFKIVSDIYNDLHIPP